MHILATIEKNILKDKSISTDESREFQSAVKTGNINLFDHSSINLKSIIITCIKLDHKERLKEILDLLRALIRDESASNLNIGELLDNLNAIMDEIHQIKEGDFLHNIAIFLEYTISVFTISANAISPDFLQPKIIKLGETLNTFINDCLNTNMLALMDKNYGAFDDCLLVLNALGNHFSEIKNKTLYANTIADIVTKIAIRFCEINVPFIKRTNELDIKIGDLLESLRNLYDLYKDVHEAYQFNLNIDNIIKHCESNESLILVAAHLILYAQNDNYLQLLENIKSKSNHKNFFTILHDFAYEASKLSEPPLEFLAGLIQLVPDRIEYNKVTFLLSHFLTEALYRNGPADKNETLLSIFKVLIEKTDFTNPDLDSLCLLFKYIIHVDNAELFKYLAGHLEDPVMHDSLDHTLELERGDYGFELMCELRNGKNLANLCDFLLTYKASNCLEIVLDESFSKRDFFLNKFLNTKTRRHGNTFKQEDHRSRYFNKYSIAAIIYYYLNLYYSEPVNNILPAVKKATNNNSYTTGIWVKNNTQFYTTTPTILKEYLRLLCKLKISKEHLELDPAAHDGYADHFSLPQDKIDHAINFLCIDSLFEALSHSDYYQHAYFLAEKIDYYQKNLSKFGKKLDKNALVSAFKNKAVLLYVRDLEFLNSEKPNPLKDLFSNKNKENNTSYLFKKIRNLNRNNNKIQTLREALPKEFETLLNYLIKSHLDDSQEIGNTDNSIFSIFIRSLLTERENQTIDSLKEMHQILLWQEADSQNEDVLKLINNIQEYAYNKLLRNIDSESFKEMRQDWQAAIEHYEKLNKINKKSSNEINMPIEDSISSHASVTVFESEYHHLQIEGESISYLKQDSTESNNPVLSNHNSRESETSSSSDSESNYQDLHNTNIILDIPSTPAQPENLSTPFAEQPHADSHEAHSPAYSNALASAPPEFQAVNLAQPNAIQTDPLQLADLIASKVLENLFPVLNQLEFRLQQSISHLGKRVDNVERNILQLKNTISDNPSSVAPTSETPTTNLKSRI